jgi:hypothetical protein
MTSICGVRTMLPSKVLPGAWGPLTSAASDSARPSQATNMILVFRVPETLEEVGNERWKHHLANTRR